MIEITKPKDAAYPVQYYGMMIHTHVNSFRLEECDPGFAVEDSIGDYIDYVTKARSRSDFKDLAMSCEEIGNRIFGVRTTDVTFGFSSQTSLPHGSSGGAENAQTLSDERCVRALKFD